MKNALAFFVLLDHILNYHLQYIRLITVIDSCACNDQCTVNGVCVDNVVVGSGTSCDCSCGFTGATCDTPITRCCNYGPCENGGSCVEAGDGTPSCECAACFTGEFCGTGKFQKGLRLS